MRVRPSWLELGGDPARTGTFTVRVKWWALPILFVWLVKQELRARLGAKP